MQVITIVQARMSSTRLPGKVMKTILGKTVLELQLERMSRSNLCGKIIVATSTNYNDDKIEEFCQANHIACFRGNENDLLDRHYQCAKFYQADVVAKIPSDCPLIDHRIIDQVFQQYYTHPVDYLSNLHPASHPDGNDVEIFSFQALEKAHKEAKRPLEREHTTPYFWENPDKFSINNFQWEKERDLSMSHRFTIDYEEDFLFIQRIYEELYPTNNDFSLDDILQLLEKKPDIYLINSNYAGVNWYRNHIDELKTINASKTKQL